MNSSGFGCRLVGSGVACVSNDTFEFEVSGAVPNSFAVLNSADNRLPNAGACLPGSGIQTAAFDGLRCIGGTLRRQGSRSINSAGGSINPWTNLIAAGGFTAGQTIQWYVIYRELPAQSCGTDSLNTSNAVQIVVTP